MAASKKKEKKVKLTKNQKKRLKRKLQKSKPIQTTKVPKVESVSIKPKVTDVEVEYVPMQLDAKDSLAASFGTVFDKFSQMGNSKETKKEETNNTDDATDLENDDAEVEDSKEVLSKKKRKLVNRLKIAQLKQLVKHPEVVEQHDVTSSDPKLLVHLKSYRNTVPVPRHWSHKRKYLQGKRGIEKPPFQLPDFIAKTGIATVRSAIDELEAGQKSKAKQRERVKPKMGKIDLDYQVLQDAFFKYQTKPKMSNHGELYYEGAEFEAKTTKKVPGVLSDGLKEALAIPEGAPPPWLIYMQQFGPPPSYPKLKIPGINAPIPAGAKWGFHAGGWGQPPRDQFGNILFVESLTEQVKSTIPEVDRTLWGELLEEEEESEVESEEEMDMDEQMNEEVQEEEDMQHVEEYQTSVPPPPPPMEEPIQDNEATTEILDLRKGGQDTKEEAPTLFKVLESKKTEVGSAMYGASHKYSMPSKNGASGVEVSLNPEELGDEEMLKIKYQEQVEAKQANKMDLTDLHEEQKRKQDKARRKREKKEKEKYKDFKF